MENATDRFLGKLVDVAEPEAKRKIIGAEFIRVFEEEARKVGNEVSFLAQGTIYPDILESKDGVKAHHNVGGLPDDLQFELCEPVKLLYKDEVRVVGCELGLPENMVEPSPPPALAWVSAAWAHHGSHYRRGLRHLPRLLRPHAQTRRHGGMGVKADTLSYQSMRGKTNRSYYER